MARPLVLHIFPTFAVGGVQLRMAAVMTYLDGRYRHLILSLDGGMSAAHCLPQDGSATLLHDHTHLKGMLAVPRMRQALKELSPDLVSTYNWGSMDWALAASLTFIPHLHFESGFGPEEAVKPFRRRSVIRRMALRKAVGLVVPSKTLETLAISEKWIDHKRLTVIANGVDTDFFSPEDKAPGKAPVILTLAPLRTEKRLDRLIILFHDVLKVAPEARLVFVGDGPCRQALEEQCNRLGLQEKVAFKGHQEDVRPMLADADILAMTSETEQMPNALLQAMAAGLAVVAYSAGDIVHMVPDRQKPCILQQNDHEGYVAALARLLADEVLRRRLGRENRSHVEKTWAMTSMLKAYDRLYRDTLGEVS